MKQLFQVLDSLNEKELHLVSVCVLIGLTLFGQSITIYIDHLQGVRPLLDWIRVAHMGIALGVLVFVIKRRKRITDVLTGSCFIIVVLPFFVTSTLYHFEGLRLLNVVPFLGQKLFFLALSVLVVGPYWINVGLMLGFAVQSVIFWVIASGAERAMFLAAAEPWATILYASVAGCLLAFRRDHLETIDRLTQLNARSEVLEQMARIFLSVRDLANTPLQSLEISIGLLEQKHPSAEDLTKRIEAAVRKLGALNTIFRYYEGTVTWNRQQPMSEEEILACLKEFDLSLKRTQKASSPQSAQGS